MAYLERPIYHFKNKGDVGIDKVPIKRIIVVENYDGSSKTFIKDSNTGLTPTSTVEDAYIGNTLSLVSGDVFLIEQPQITIPEEGSFTSSAFATVDSYTGTHDFVHWEIATDSAFSNVVDSYSGSSNLLSYTFDGSPSTTYYVRVRYGSDNHLSEWANPVSYSTGAVATPILSGTTTGNETETIVLTIDNYDSSGTYNISVTAGSYTQNGSEISWTLPEVTVDTLHTLTISFTNAALQTSLENNYDVTVFDVVIEGDTAIQTTDYGVDEGINDGYEYV